MSNEHKPLSERVRGCAYIVPDPHPTDTDASEREVLGLNRVADEIANLEQRLAEAESWRGQIDAFVRRIMGEVNCGKACGGLDWDQNNPQSTTQVVLDGIKAHTQAAIDAALIDLIHDLGGLYIHRNGHELYNSAIDDVARFIKGQLGTNPLAEAQTKIKELNGLCLYHEGLERELQARIAELESVQKHNLRDGNWLDDLGCCRVCDGEIPYGHTSDCDYYKLEKRLAEAERILRDTLDAIPGEAIGKKQIIAFLENIHD